MLAQLGGGIAAIVLGLLPVLAALGLVETEGGIEPVGRVVAFLFGGVFVTIGGWLAGRPFVSLARARGAVTWRDALAMGARHLRRRANRVSGAAAAGVGLLAVACWLAAAGLRVPLLGDADTLRAIVIIEFLVIHGFPFLVITAAIARRTTGRARVVATGAVGLLLLLYGLMAWKAGDGFGGVVALLYLVMPNVLAFYGASTPASDRVLVTSRWVIKFALFILTVAVIGGGSFDGPETVWVGAVYFTLLAGVEAFRITEVPGELVA